MIAECSICKSFMKHEIGGGWMAYTLCHHCKNILFKTVPWIKYTQREKQL